MKAFLAAALVFSTVGGALALEVHRPLNGIWKFEYSCAGSSRMYANRCAAGDRDYFDLSIVQAGSRFCGRWDVSAQLENHVDDGFLNDWTFTPAPNGSFHVHYDLGNMVGEAIIRRAGNELHWVRLSEQPKDDYGTWRFSAPQTATLVLQPRDPTRAPPSCAR